MLTIISTPTTTITTEMVKAKKIYKQKSCKNDRNKIKWRNKAKENVNIQKEKREIARKSTKWRQQWKGKNKGKPYWDNPSCFRGGD